MKPAGKRLQEHAEVRSFWTLPTVHVCSQRLRRFQNRSVYLELRRGGSPSRAALSGGCLSPHPDVPGLRQSGTGVRRTVGSGAQAEPPVGGSLWKPRPGEGAGEDPSPATSGVPPSPPAAHGAQPQAVSCPNVLPRALPRRAKRQPESTRECY